MQNLTKSKFSLKCLQAFLVVLLSWSCVTAPTGNQNGKVVQTENSTCHLLNPENEFSPIVVCDRNQNYEIQVVTQKYVINKTKAHGYLSELILNYLQMTEFSVEMLSMAHVELWINAKVFVPSSCEIVAVVTTPSGNLAFHLDVNPSLWAVDPTQIDWLGKEGYPSMKMERLGVLQLQPKQHISQQTIDLLLEESGIGDLHGKTGRPLVQKWENKWPYLLVYIEPFSEDTVLKKLAQHPAAKAMLDDVVTLGRGDFEGYKARFGEFHFQGTN